MILMGIGGCFMSNLLAAVAANQLNISDLSVDISATLEESPPKFSAIELTVHSAFSDREALQNMVVKAEAACIAINTTRDTTHVSVKMA